MQVLVEFIVLPPVKFLGKGWFPRPGNFPSCIFAFSGPLKTTSCLALRLQSVRFYFRDKMGFMRAWISVFLVMYTLQISLATIPMPQKAQQLLKYNFETKTFVLDARFLVEISKLRGPILVVSAVGNARIGKSTTLNLVHHFWDENSFKLFYETFETGDTKTPVTHGVWASIIPAKTPDDSNAILLDVEGLNLGDDDVTTHLSMFTVLVSSSVHIFTHDSVQNHVLDFLYHISRLAGLIFPDEGFDNFPHLGVIVRGALKTPPGYTLDEHVQNSILGLDHNDGMQEQRKAIGKYFTKEKISANQIPYVQDITIFKDMNKLRNTDFYKLVLSLVNQFKKSPPKKSLKGNLLMDGESLARLLKQLFQAMKNNSWWDFNNAYRMLEGQICTERYDKIVRPVLDKTASEIIGANLEATMAEFKANCALEEEVDSARKELLDAKKRAIEIEKAKQRAADEEQLREKTEIKMKNDREEWEKKMEDINLVLSQEVEQREQLQTRNEKLEKENERQARQISGMSKRTQGGTGGGSVESFVGAALGAFAATAAYWFSDQRLKRNVTLLPHSEYDNICLRGVSWKWSKTAKERFGLEGEGRGVIAQEVEKLYPFAVTQRSDGYKQVNYKLLELMIKAAQKQRNCVSQLSSKRSKTLH